MSLTKNYFQLFDLPEQYCLDKNALRSIYRELQRKAHPDKFAGDSRQQQLLAVQYAATINDAYDVLASPLKRAIYMLKLRGFEVDAQHSAPMDSTFLMAQMELREELEQVPHAENPEIALEKIGEQLDKELQNLQGLFKVQIEHGCAAELKAAVETVKKMQFLNKIRSDLEHLAHELLMD